MTTRMYNAVSVRKRGDVKSHFFPETGAGGYSRVDGTVEFYARVNALLRPEMKILDFGAGRGASLQDDSSTYRRELQRLQGKVESVVGVDVDEDIDNHPALDDRRTIAIGEPLPFEDDSFDLIVSDHVFEHIDDPVGVTRELARVLKPGGWICSRTPHKWGYIGIGARSVPNRLHRTFLSKLQSTRKYEDVFPTRYRMNTLGTIKRYFPAHSWENYSYEINPEPAYFGNSRIAWAIMLIYFRLMPRLFPQSVLLFFLKKK